MPWKDKNEWRKHRDPAKHREVQRRYRERTLDIASANAKRRMRAAANAALGNVCCRCGFSDWRALEIDHVNNDGYLERVNGKRKTRWQMLKEIVQHGGQDRYQLLCANCHQIKSYEEVWKFGSRKRAV